MILLDLVMPGEDGISFLRWLRESGRRDAGAGGFGFGYGEDGGGSAAERRGGLHCEGIRHRGVAQARGESAAALGTGDRKQRLRRELVADGQFGRMLGASAAMRRVFEMAERVAATDATVLILGESGTGKDLLAQEIHERSPRAGKAFVAVNCAALPENLIESELFGYERGAFTGAAQQRKGKFELASGGTIFLDEIGDMNPVTQAKVLRALENRKIERLGGIACD